MGRFGLHRVLQEKEFRVRATRQYRTRSQCRTASREAGDEANKASYSSTFAATRRRTTARVRNTLVEI